MWAYDIATDTQTHTGQLLKGGFWNGQAQTKNRNTIYLSTVSGERTHARSHSRFGVGLRVDLQLNVGSVYTLGIGADGVWAVSGGLIGVHASFLGFRFGAEREFFVNLPQHLWVNFDASWVIVEQLLSVSYLFGL